MKVQASLALGRQRKSDMETGSFAEAAVKRFVSFQEAVENAATFHPATISNGTMKQVGARAARHRQERSVRDGERKLGVGERDRT